MLQMSNESIEVVAHLLANLLWVRNVLVVGDTIDERAKDLMV